MLRKILMKVETNLHEDFHAVTAVFNIVSNVKYSHLTCKSNKDPNPNGIKFKTSEDFNLYTMFN